MRLLKLLSAVCTAIFTWLGLISGTDEARVQQTRHAAARYMSSRGSLAVSVRPGDRVVFANPKSGWDYDVMVAKAAGLRVGREYTVSDVDIGDWMCRLQLEGVSGNFNSVQFA